ncbi:MAG: hypothetical protein DHS20C17_16930 [Cyclobacteriaceae bacterium]|nr:MAG: hypothetical protein DHS20C17_16930 [Cyclobacteriaceae bacterium]
MKTEKVFVYIWEYLVKEDCLLDFKQYYDPEGEWVQLFRKGTGYIATELHQDVSNPRRFITIDYWKTIHYRDRFRYEFSKEFQTLDKLCEDFTEKEILIGDFDTYINKLL